MNEFTVSVTVGNVFVLPTFIMEFVCAAAGVVVGVYILPSILRGKWWECKSKGERMSYWGLAFIVPPFMPENKFAFWILTPLIAHAYEWEPHTRLFLIFACMPFLAAMVRHALEVKRKHGHEKH